ncbi:MAG TPA: hypothetical protein VFP92_06545 [Rhodanobacteraceae bacterium]|nr:hypothetical protein [Rhodanobacteraceae bacterium]
MTGQAALPRDADEPRARRAGWIAALAFAPRKESWVASSEDNFYKIFRNSDDPARDWLDPACIEQARREYADMQLLHRFSGRVCRPLRVDHACVVYPHLSGPDLRVTLRRRGGAQGATALRDAMSLLARLHAAGDAALHYPLKDYLVHNHLRPDANVLRRIAERERTLCIEGFEVRNFRYDRDRNAWLFFDPQVVHRGVPENDLARFLVSLLMVNWGKGGSPKIWTGFESRDLVSSYEHAASRPVDKILLNYFLHETIAMRRHFAERALRALHGVPRLLGRPYLAAYFLQLEKWVTSHGF